jgi:M6 family metalloprotease-like protein
MRIMNGLKSHKLSLLWVFALSLIVIFPEAVNAMPPHPKLVEEWKKQGIFKEKMAAYHQRMLALRSGKLKSGSTSQKSFPKSGNRKVCVLLIRYSDQAMNSGSIDTFYSNLFNGGGATTLTWKKYYQDMSNNTLNLQFDVYGPYTASNTHNYYGQNDLSGNDLYPRELVAEAIDLANTAGVDFSQYDNDGDGYVDGIIIIHQGAGEEASGTTADIWSHQWNLSSPKYYDGVYISNYSIQPEYVFTALDSTVGVFCHEFGHVLGLPDLYDTSYETDGVGEWSLMAGGSWNGSTGNGDVPAPLLAWERKQLGWVTYSDITSSSTFFINKRDNLSLPLLMFILITLTGMLSIIFTQKKLQYTAAVLPVLFASMIIMFQPSCGGGGGGDDSSGSGIPKFDKIVSIADINTSHKAIKVPLGDPYNEQYILVENIVRTAGDWTEYLPGSGLLITMINDYEINTWWDDNVINYGASYAHGVSIIEADGNYHLWDPLDGNSGDAQDTYYSGNVTSLTPSTTPDTNYTAYSSYAGNNHYYQNPYSVNSGVSITEISAKGTNMTFHCSN